MKVLYIIIVAYRMWFFYPFLKNSIPTYTMYLLSNYFIEALSNINLNIHLYFYIRNQVEFQISLKAK